MMKWLILVAAGIAVDINGYCFDVYNNTRDSFDINITIKENTGFAISDCDWSSTEIKNFNIQGNAKIKYSVRYPGKYEYVIKEEEIPWISFRNVNGEFDILFHRYRTAKLRSSSATEIHNYSGSDSHKYEYIGCDNASHIGIVINLVLVGPYRIVYCYEKHGKGCFFAIEYITDSDAWMEKVSEENLLFGKSKFDIVKKQKQSWWSRLSCCDSCCTD